MKPYKVEIRKEPAEPATPDMGKRPSSRRTPNLANLKKQFLCRTFNYTDLPTFGNAFLLAAKTFQKS